MAKAYKGYKRGGVGQHVQLPEWLQASEAWATMKPGPRALYVELKRRFNGSNNGAIFLSHRDAAAALNLHRNTVGPMFRELERRGFIRLAIAPHLGPSGVGEASVWTLEELPTKDGKLAGKAFMRRGEKQKPRTEIVQPRHKKGDADDATEAENLQAVTNSVTSNGPKAQSASQ